MNICNKCKTPICGGECDCPSKTAALSLPVVETLNKLPEVTWDRFAGDLINGVSVYGWIHRDDGKSDYVLVMIDIEGPWLISTSSAKYSADFSARLGMGGTGHTPCRRVEDHFDGVRCVHLKDDLPKCERCGGSEYVLDLKTGESDPCPVCAFPKSPQ